jgi:hypothetical protein
VASTTGGTEDLKPCGQVVATQEFDGALSVLLGQPRVVPELDGKSVLRQLLPACCDVVTLLVAGIEPRRELEEHHAQLCGTV